MKFKIIVYRFNRVPFIIDKIYEDMIYYSCFIDNKDFKLRKIYGKSSADIKQTSLFTNNIIHYDFKLAFKDYELT